MIGIHFAIQDGDAADLHGGSGDPGGELHRRVVAQRFLDRGGGQAGVGAQRRKLVRVPEQGQNRVRDQ